MSEAVSLDQARSRTQAAEWLAMRLEDLQDDTDGGGWSALCPLCDGEARIQISRGMKPATCPNGHTPQLVARALDTTPTRLGLKPIAVLLAEDIPETRWLVSPWIESGSIGMIVAPPNIGKTLLAFYFATLVACKKMRVAIIEEEGGRRGFQKRISRAVAAVGGEVMCQTIEWSFKPRIHLMNEEDKEALCEELQGYDMVLIDSLARVITGIEENDAKEMGQIVEILDFIRERTGASVWTVHHTGKSKWKPGEAPRLEDGRGSSALQAGLDTVLGLAPVGDREPGVVQFELHVTKQRDEDVQVTPRRVRITMTGPAAIVEMEEVDVSHEPSMEPFMRFRDKVLAAVPFEPGATTRTEIVKAVPGTRTDKFKCINWMLRKEQIHEDRDGAICRKNPSNSNGSNRFDEKSVRGSEPDGEVF